MLKRIFFVAILAWGIYAQSTTTVLSRSDGGDDSSSGVWTRTGPNGEISLIIPTSSIVTFVFPHSSGTQGKTFSAEAAQSCTYQSSQPICTEFFTYMWDGTTSIVSNIFSGSTQVGASSSPVSGSASGASLTSSESTTPSASGTASSSVDVPSPSASTGGGNGAAVITTSGHVIVGVAAAFTAGGYFL